MKRFIFIVLGFVLAAYLQEIVASERMSGGPFNSLGGGINIQQLQSELGLTEEQVSKLKELKTKNVENTKETRKKLNEKQAELQNIMQSDNPNKDEALKIADELGVMRTEMKKINIANRIDTLNIYTPEQRDKLKQLQQGREKRNSRFRKALGLKESQ